MIADIRLQHFRSYDDASFGFEPGVNVVAGPNASGKTNLLEAILVVSRGSSYRARDAELMQFGAPWARLEAHADTHDHVVKLQADGMTVKSFVIDEQPLSRLHPSKMLPVVLFEPNHLLLLSGSPDLRRSFMDDLIEQTDLRFGSVRRHYKRVLAQRNSLLKQRPRNLAEQLFVWNVRLGELGGQIARQRAELVAQLNKQISELYSEVAQHPTKVELEYASRFRPEQYESDLVHKLETSTELDAQRGFTAYGPHRDDLAASINGHPVQEAASRGEARTLVLALKLLELQLIEQARGTKPMLLLDDVFSELDSARRHSLTTFLRSYQTFITTTDADIVAPHTEHYQLITTAPLGKN